MGVSTLKRLAVDLKLQYIGTLLLIAFFAVVLFHRLTRDRLLFESDGYSLFVYFGAMTTFLTVMLAVVLLPLCYFISSAYRQKVYIFVLFAILSILCGFFLYIYLIDNILLALALAGFIVYLLSQSHSMKTQIIRRLEYLSIAAAFVLVITPLLVVANHWQPLSTVSEKEERHLVILVMDGMPSQYMRDYSTSMPPLLEEPHGVNKRVFRNMHTLTPYTAGFFGQFYSKTPQLAHRSEQVSLLPESDSLIRIFQQQDIATRWMVRHSNAIPDMTLARVNDYRGLRSLFLSEYTVWLPQWLGLDYHVFLVNHALYKPDLEKKMLRRTIMALTQKAFASYAQDDIDFYIEQMAKQQRNSRQSVTIIHNFWRQALTTKGQCYMEHGARMGLAGPPNCLQATIDNDYRYPVVCEPFVEDMNKKAMQQMLQTESEVQALINALFMHENTKSTTVVLTADHGTIYGKGRLWYGYHPNEEVIKVPLIIYGDAMTTGVDERLFSTQDLLCYVLGYFSLVDDACADAQSFFADNAGRDVVYSLALRSDVQQEWFLLIKTNAGLKYQMNIHPESKGEIYAIEVDGYEESIVAEYDEVPAFLVEKLKEAMHVTQLTAQDDIHPRFYQYSRKVA